MAQAGRSMATGHFLCIGDKTNYGGEILEGYAGWISNGRPRARAGAAYIEASAKAELGHGKA
jgi:uncharacterized Zn-binding protein involved in type VI secretion